MTKPILYSFPGALAAVVLTFAPIAHADQQMTFSYPMQMGVRASVTEGECLSSSGPTIEMDGDINLGPLTARIIFSNNVKGTHTIAVVGHYDVQLVANGSSISIPKQPVKGGVGGNPYIYLKFTNGRGHDLSTEFFLGRCVQGLNVSADLLQTAAALANVASGNCSNKGGPTITLDGQITLGGLHATFIFRNNPKGTHTAEDSRDVGIILEGSKILIPKQPANGGVGGNPLISIQFMQGATPIGAPFMLGRCNQI